MTGDEVITAISKLETIGIAAIPLYEHGRADGVGFLTESRDAIHKIRSQEELDGFFQRREANDADG